MRKRISSYLCLLGLLLSTMYLGCEDAGTDPPQLPLINSIDPRFAFAGDTITIKGSAFGDSQGSSGVTIGGSNAASVVSWTQSLIEAVVPVEAASGNVTVTVGGKASNSDTFVLLLTSAAISYSQDVQPIFTQRCVGCHGGTNNLFLNSRSQLMAGTSNNGPAVISGHGERSLIVKKLRGTAPFGSRMPLGGPYLPDSTTNKVSIWIQQGAIDN